MKRLIINLLAVIGTLAVVGTLTGAALRALAGPDHVIVLGAKGKPLPNAPVFLDRGSMAIERYVTDSAGRLRFELTTGELRRATWLVCAPGAIPMVGTRDDDQAGPTTYSFTALHDSSWGGIAPTDGAGRSHVSARGAPTALAGVILPRVGSPKKQSRSQSPRGHISQSR